MTWLNRDSFESFLAISAKTIPVVVATAHAVISFIAIPALLKEKDTYKKIPFILVPIGLSVFGYFLAYVSSTSSLALNAINNLKAWYFNIPTCIGVTVYNGFSNLTILMNITQFILNTLIHSSEKRSVLGKLSLLENFLSRDVGIVGEIAELQLTGIPLRSIRRREERDSLDSQSISYEYASL